MQALIGFLFGFIIAGLILVRRYKEIKASNRRVTGLKDTALRDAGSQIDSMADEIEDLTKKVSSQQEIINSLSTEESIYVDSLRRQLLEASDSLSKVNTRLEEKLNEVGQVKTESQVLLCQKEEELEKCMLDKRRLEQQHKTESQIHQTRSSQTLADGNDIILKRREADLYPGEQREIVLRTIQQGSERCMEDGRIQHVLCSLLEMNQPHQVMSELEESVRNILINASQLGTREKSALQRLGFKVKSENNHLKLVFKNDDRYTFVTAKTHGDRRGMKNFTSEVTKRPFK